MKEAAICWKALSKEIGAEKAADLDDEIRDYMVDVVLQSESAEEAACGIGPLLLDTECITNEDDVHAMCSRMFAELELEDHSNFSSSVVCTGPKKLQTSVSLGTPLGPGNFASATQTTQATETAQPELSRKLVRQEKRAEAEALRKQNKEQKEAEALTDYSGMGRISSNNAKSGKQDVRVHTWTMSYGKLQLLVNSDLCLLSGRRYGLVGRNGSGKTTLLRHISHRLVDYPSNISVLLVDQEVVGSDCPVVQAVLEADQIRSQLLKEEKQLLESCPSSRKLVKIYSKLQEIDSDTAETRANVILAGLGFNEDQKKGPTAELSGGWRMRVALARALFNPPDLLLLDEPTNFLDLHAVLWLERFLSQWPKTLVLVSHQRDFLNGVITDVMHVTKKKLVYYRGNYDDFERVAGERLRQQQSDYDSQLLQRKHIQTFVDRFRFNAKRASLVQSRLKKLDRMQKVEAIVEEGAVTLQFVDPEALSPPILQCQGVSFAYRPGSLVLKDIDFSVDLDSRIALVGSNGAGKTTLLRLLAGELQPCEGSVQRNGKLRIGLFRQHHVDQLDLELSPLQNLSPQTPHAVLRAHLGKYGISGNTALQQMETLSGGQKSRVVFARIAWHEPHMLLMDEPSSFLDIETIEGLAKSLTTYQGGIVMVSHDQRLISLVCDELWCVGSRRVTQFQGSMMDYRRHIESING